MSESEPHTHTHTMAQPTDEEAGQSNSKVFDVNKHARCLAQLGYHGVSVLAETAQGAVVKATTSTNLSDRHHHHNMEQKEEGDHETTTGERQEHVVAIKVSETDRFLPGCGEDALFEAAMLRNLPPHPQVVKFENFVVTESVVSSTYLVMEFVPHGDLFTVTRDLDPAIRTAHTPSWFRQMTFALDHLHKHQLAHMDLALENFLVCDIPTSSHRQESRVKLCDLGLAKAFDPLTKRLLSPNPRMHGRLNYLCPELVKARELEGAKLIRWVRGEVNAVQADLFALGVALVILTHRCILFERADLRKDKRYARTQRPGGVSALLRGWGFADQAAEWYSLVEHLLCPETRRLTDTNAVMQHAWWRLVFAGDARRSSSTASAV